jgi:hypothetical protein
MKADRVVLDTNVLISAALRPGSVLRVVIDTVSATGGVLVFSEESFHELQSRLLRSKFDPYVRRQDRMVFLAQVRAVSEWVSITGAKLGCRDPEDDKILETALMGDADCVVTGDRDLLVMSSFSGIPIVRPATFLELLGRD